MAVLAMLNYTTSRVRKMSIALNVGSYFSIQHNGKNEMVNIGKFRKLMPMN